MHRAKMEEDTSPQFWDPFEDETSDLRNTVVSVGKHERNLRGTTVSVGVRKLTFEWEEEDAALEEHYRLVFDDSDEEVEHELPGDEADQELGKLSLYQRGSSGSTGLSSESESLVSNEGFHSDLVLGIVQTDAHTQPREVGSLTVSLPLDNDSDSTTTQKQTSSLAITKTKSKKKPSGSKSPSASLALVEQNQSEVNTGTKKSAKKKTKKKKKKKLKKGTKKSKVPAIASSDSTTGISNTTGADNISPGSDREQIRLANAARFDREQQDRAEQLAQLRLSSKDDLSSDDDETYYSEDDDEYRADPLLEIHGISTIMEEEEEEEEESEEEDDEEPITRKPNDPPLRPSLAGHNPKAKGTRVKFAESVGFEKNMERFNREMERRRKEVAYVRQTLNPHWEQKENDAQQWLNDYHEKASKAYIRNQAKERKQLERIREQAIRASRSSSARSSSSTPSLKLPTLQEDESASHDAEQDREIAKAAQKRIESATEIAQTENGKVDSVTLAERELIRKRNEERFWMEMEQRKKVLQNARRQLGKSSAARNKLRGWSTRLRNLSPLIIAPSATSNQTSSTTNRQSGGKKLAQRLSDRFRRRSSGKEKGDESNPDFSDMDEDALARHYRWPSGVDWIQVKQEGFEYDLDLDPSDMVEQRNMRQLLDRLNWDGSDVASNTGQSDDDSSLEDLKERGLEAASSDVDDGPPGSNREDGSPRKSLALLWTQRDEVEAQPLRKMRGFINKLSVVSQKNWRKRYIVFHPKARTITYYRRKRFSKHMKVRGVFTLNPKDHPNRVQVIVHPKREPGEVSVLEIYGGHIDKPNDIREDHSLFLSFDCEKELHNWRDALLAMIASWYHEDHQLESENEKSYHALIESERERAKMLVDQQRVETPVEKFKKRSKKDKKRKTKKKKKRQAQPVRQQMIRDSISSTLSSMSDASSVDPYAEETKQIAHQHMESHLMRLFSDNKWTVEEKQYARRLVSDLVDLVVNDSATWEEVLEAVAETL